MIIKSIEIHEGLFERKVLFSDFNNLIFSKKNSRGKTTLLRFILFGLGYNIPNTKNIKFEKCNIIIKLFIESKGSIILKRESSNILEMEVLQSGDKISYILPDQLNDLHEYIYGTDNLDIQNNLLGAYYVDQEKGWTLLNRGTVIGSIHFNIEELIRGLSKIDCIDLIKREKKIEREISKYKQMYSIIQYRSAIEKESGSFISDKYDIEIDNSLDNLLNEKRMINSELRRIDSTLKDNTKFKKFIANMKLQVQLPNGDIFQVTEDNIVGLNDSVDLLLAKRKSIAQKYNNITTKIEAIQLEKEQKLEDVQMSFFEEDKISERFDKAVCRLPFNQIAIKQELDSLYKEKREISEEISRITKEKNSMASVISKNIIKYASDLELGNKDSISERYLFTSNLKELSGAVLHKTAFAFRLAYIVAIENVLGIKLPLILDSPSGKEVDPENIRLMMNILKRDFSDHQIIIASIYSYDLQDVNIIEIKDKLVEEQSNFSIVD